MAGLPEPLNSPYGNRPQTLPNPSPNEGLETEVRQMQAKQAEKVDDISIGRIPASAGGSAAELAQAPTAAIVDPANAPSQELDVDSFLSGLAQEEQTGMQDSPLPAPEGFASVKEQLTEAGARLKNAFTMTPKESIQVLKGFPKLFQDVRLKDGSVQVKRPGRQGWENFDRDKFELIGDTLDFARDAFEIPIEAGVEIGGTALGAIATRGPGGVPANIASGAAGALAAKNAGDIVAQNIMGIERDPERSETFENSIAAGFGAGFGWMGGALSRRAVKKKFLAKESAKTVETMQKRVNETLEDVDIVRQSGIKLDPETGTFKLDANVATGGMDPDAKATAKWLSDTDGYQNFYNEMGQSIRGAYDSVMDRIGSFAGKDTANLGEEFVLTSKDVRKAEGKLIGDWVQFADKATRSKRQAAPRTFQTIQMFGSELGDKKGKITVESAIDNFGLDESKARMLVGKINKAKAMSKQGQMSVDMSKSLYDDLVKRINQMGPLDKGSTHQRALIDLKDAVRDDWVDMVENVLPPAQKGAFEKSRARYREIMQATNSLGKVLDSEDISRDVLVKQLFEGKKGYEFMKSAKTLIEETNPEMWAGLSHEYFNRLKRNAMDVVVETGEDGIAREVRKFNWNKIGKQWGDLDPRIQRELAQTANIPPKAMDSLLQLGKRYQDADVGFMAKKSESVKIRGLIKNAFSFFLGGGSAKGTAATSLLEGIGKDGAMMKWMQSGDNLEGILREIKGLNPSKRKMVEDFVYSWNVPSGISRASQAGSSTELRNMTLDDK